MLFEGAIKSLEFVYRQRERGENAHRRHESSGVPKQLYWSTGHSIHEASFRARFEVLAAVLPKIQGFQGCDAVSAVWIPTFRMMVASSSPRMSRPRRVYPIFSLVWLRRTG